MTCSDQASPPRTSFSFDPDGGLLQSPEFEFSVAGSFEVVSSADELFSNGVILPLRAGRRPSPPVPTPNSLPPVVPVPIGKTHTHSRHGVTVEDVDFPKRSRSVFCSFPLLPRSNSTGSTKRAVSRKSSIAMRKSLSVPSSSDAHSWYVKNASGRRHERHAVRVSPVLNVPTACICDGTASLFGLGSWLCRGRKDKDKDKDNHSGRR